MNTKKNYQLTLLIYNKKFFKFIAINKIYLNKLLRFNYQDKSIQTNLKTWCN